MAADIRQDIILLLPRLRRFARGLTGIAAEADDLVQGACERALRAAHTWQPGTRLDSWLFRILRNLWIDDLRRRRVSVGGDEPFDPPGEDGRSVTEARLDLARVRERIAELAPVQREVLVLVCIEDLSYREAAQVLDVPIGTIMSRLARARQALAASLGEGVSTPVRGAVR